MSKEKLRKFVLVVEESEGDYVPQIYKSGMDYWDVMIILRHLSRKMLKDLKKKEKERVQKEND